MKRYLDEDRNYQKKYSEQKYQKPRHDSHSLEGGSSSSNSISSIVANHYNSINNNGIDERKKSRIYFMRNFNNWVKSIIIRDTIRIIREQKHPEDDEFIVHDLACGKGGDLNKYKTSKITYFVGSDIASVSIEHCKERYRQIRNYFQAEFINIDCSRELVKNKLKNRNMVFDMTSCQFSFHYCFESYEQVKMMIKNASEKLKIGGIFCGTIPDSNEIIKRLKLSKSNEFGNDVYKIKFSKTYDELVETGVPLFGCKYYFQLDEVVDCPEFIVHFSSFEEICQSYGLKLIFKNRFDIFFEQNRDGEQNSDLLNYMDALEKYPPKNNEKLMGKSQDYKHIREFLMENKSGQSIDTIGTLSKSEWEAVTLYLVFSFRKISENNI